MYIDETHHFQNKKEMDLKNPILNTLYNLCMIQQSSAPQIQKVTHNTLFTLFQHDVFAQLQLLAKESQIKQYLEKLQTVAQIKFMLGENNFGDSKPW